MLKFVKLSERTCIDKRRGSKNDIDVHKLQEFQKEREKKFSTLSKRISITRSIFNQTPHHDGMAELGGSEGATAPLNFFYSFKFILNFF